MRHPAQVATGGWVMLGLLFKWFPLCEFSLSDSPWGEFSGSLGCWSQCSHSKGSGLDLCSGTKIPQVVCYALSEIKTNIQKWESKDEPQTNGSYKIRQIIIKIMEYTPIRKSKQSPTEIKYSRMIWQTKKIKNYVYQLRTKLTTAQTGKRKCNKVQSWE